MVGARTRRAGTRKARTPRAGAHRGPWRRVWRGLGLMLFLTLVAGPVAAVIVYRFAPPPLTL